jgi:hypothetical protein
MVALVAMLLSQACSVTDGIVCPGPIKAPRGQFYVLEPYTAAAGNALQSRRSADDQGADLVLLGKDGEQRNVDTIHLEMRRGGQAVLRILNSGEVQAGGHQDSEASFTDMSTADGHAFGRCLPGAGDVGGCYLAFRADMSPANAAAFHGLMTLGNVRPRDGGVLLQLQGAGKSAARGPVFHGTVAAVDEFGNLVLRDGWIYQSLRTAERGACYTAPVWDGEWHQPGGYGYDVDEDALVFRSASACAADGGVEHVVTDRSLSAALAVIGARLSALEAR